MWKQSTERKAFDGRATHRSAVKGVSDSTYREMSAPATLSPAPPNAGPSHSVTPRGRSGGGGDGDGDGDGDSSTARTRSRTAEWRRVGVGEEHGTPSTATAGSGKKSLGGGSSGPHGTPRTHCEKVAFGIAERAVVGESSGEDTLLAPATTYYLPSSELLFFLFSSFKKSDT